MSVLFELLGVATLIVSIVCWFIILIDAFKDAIWKGIVSLLCGLYLLYYAIFDFEHDNKWLIIILGFFGGAAAGVFFRLAQ